MTRLGLWSFHVLVAFLMVFATRAHAQCQSGWLDAPDIPGTGYGTNGFVRAVTTWTPVGATQPVLVVGGIFTSAGSTTANNIAIWDGSTWQNMSSGLTGSNAVVQAITVYNNQVVAAGTFNTAGGVAANNIARWTGTTWQTLGSGLSATGLVSVHALCVYNGLLYASGEFSTAGGTTIAGMARWNGTSWSSAPLGPGAETEAYALAVYNNQLYAGGLGSFSGQTILYRFDGTTWFTTPGPIIGTLDVNDSFPSIRALTVWNNKLVVAGNFHDVAGFINVGGVAAWDGGTWSHFSTGMDKVVYTLTTVGGNLYAGGAFSTASSVLSFRAARWNGSNWNGLDSSMSGSGFPSVFAACEFNGEFIGAGNFTTVTGLQNVATVNNVGRYNPTTQKWSATHTASPIRVFSGAVTAAGDFTLSTPGGQARRVVGWNGSDFGVFTDLGGFTGPNGPIYAIGSLSTNPFTPAFTVLGGSFTSNAGTTANNICTYRFGVWGTLGSGFNGIVRALATYNGALYAAGDFTASGAVACNHVAKYVSGAWQDVGGGFNGSVNALYTFNGALYAGGNFTTAGGNPALYLAAWNGTSWSGLPDGLAPNGTGSGVYCLTSHSVASNPNSPFLDVGGKFVVASTPSLQNLASRGSLTIFFVSAGTAFNDTVRALTTYQGNLVAGGDFTSGSGVPYNHIARLVFGSGWQAMGSGVDAPVFALLSAWHTELHVGGAFGEAGGVPAESWARWNTTGAPAILTEPSNQTTDGNCHATFTVTPVASYTNLSYQWLKNGVQINNGSTATGSTVAGATTATLSLSNLDHPDQGAYTCAVSNSCGSTLSNAANLSVVCCGHSDFNHDGDLGTDADIAAFFACLAGDCCATCGSADINGDGDLGTDEDIAAFFRILSGGGC